MAAKKDERINKMLAGKQEKARREQTIIDQAAEIEKLKTQIADKNVESTVSYMEIGQPDNDIQSELDSLKQELDALKVVLSHSGAMPKKVATTQPWKSIGKPFHKDIFKTKGQHKGFELGFIQEHELDNYQSDGYNIAKGQDYGEKEGVLKRKRLIGVERPIKAAEEDREMLRNFNEAQRTSALQKTKDMSDAIGRASGNKTTLDLGYEVAKNS